MAGYLRLPIRTVLPRIVPSTYGIRWFMMVYTGYTHIITVTTGVLWIDPSPYSTIHSRTRMDGVFALKDWEARS